MRRSVVYLAFLFICLVVGSFVLQSEINRPKPALDAATDYQLVHAEFCVFAEAGNYLGVRVVSGEIPQGSVGRRNRANLQINQGDCLSGILQLSPAKFYERFAFHAKLKEVAGKIVSDPNSEYLVSVRKFVSSLKGDPANLVVGLAIGFDQGLSKTFLENMKVTGLTHLTAVSGANCAIVLGLIWLLLRSLPIGRGLRTVISLTSLAGYVFLVGWQPSVLRSAFMMACVYVALEFGRKIWLPAALLIGSAVLLVVDPWLLFEYGFWLSVFATLGLVLLASKLISLFEKRMPKWVAIGLAATVSAQLWCLPILVSLQGGFATHSLLANLLVEPMVPVITVLGVLGALAGPVAPALGEFLIWLASFPAGWLVTVANALASAPATLLPIGQDIFGITLVAVFVLCLTLFLVKRRFLYLVISIALVSVWIGSLAGLFAKATEFSLRNWDVLACNVGQGDALLIRSQGETALIDVGKDSKLIDSCLDQSGVTSIDLLVLTHFDQDHVGGWEALLKNRKVSRVLISQFPDTREVSRSTIDALSATGSEILAAPKGLTGKIGLFTWQVISSLGSLGKSANESSLALRFESDALIVYTLADLNQSAQANLESVVFDSGKPTLVKVSHHGSADQDAEFYKRIGADVAIISVGVGNPYGHPTRSCINLLEDSGVKIFRTDILGAISISVSQGAIEVMGSEAR